MLPRPPLHLTALAASSMKELQALWLHWFETPPPAHARRSLLLWALAYRMQEREYGGLSPALRAQLRALGGVRQTLVRQDVLAPRHLTPGTHVIREWGNERHQVTVETAGLVYRGRRYRSLSEIARKITGTRWSGPVFFGLKATREASRQEGQR